MAGSCVLARKALIRYFHWEGPVTILCVVIWVGKDLLIQFASQYLKIIEREFLFCFGVKVDKEFIIVFFFLNARLAISISFYGRRHRT